VPINGIFLAPSLLEGARGGYFAFSEGLGSDHQGIWQDIPASVLWGTKHPTIHPSKSLVTAMQNFKCDEKYNEHLQASLQEKQLLQEK